MNVLVTGGAGFIGSHLVDRLLQDKHRVIVIDDLSEGKMSNLPVDHPNLTFIRDYISETSNIVDGLETIDVVYHLAALPRPQLSIVDPMTSNAINVGGTLSVLMACKSYRIKRLVFASSASIYGEQSCYPSRETDDPNPMSPYALQKFVGEQYCKLFFNLYGIETNCLRLFNVYGSRMNPQGDYASVIPRFIDQISRGKTSTIYGSGEQRRDFVHVDDVVEAFAIAGISEAYGEVFNIGYGVSYSVNRVFEIIKHQLLQDVEATHGPPVSEPTQTLADWSKADRILGWHPTISLYHGIERLVNDS